MEGFPRVQWLTPLAPENRNKEIYQIRVRSLDLIPEIKRLASRCGAEVSHSKSMRVTFDVETIDGRMGRDDFLNHLPKGIQMNRIK